MKILCSLSGIEFTCEHFPGTFHSREAHHPIFTLEQKKLLSYLGKWSQGGLTETDSYLLFLALLNSTELVNFRTAVYRTERTASIVANNIELLSRAIIKLNAVTNTSLVFPSYAITADTRTLDNINIWISNWLDEYTAWITNYKGTRDGTESRKLILRETALERLIKNPHKPVSSYASQIADWAAVAGSFPQYLITSPFSGMKIPMSDYWKNIISRCSRAESIFSVPRVDLEDLYEHCQLNIPPGSIYSNALFKVLKGAMEKQKNFLGLGDQDLSKTNYTLLKESTNVEDSNIKMMVDSAPKEAPRRDQYVKHFDYLRAKARWEVAIRYKKELDGGDDKERPKN